MFTHLHVHSNFSFLDGGSSVQALLDRAKEIGCDSLAITDHNGLYGAVRFYDYALKAGVKPIVGVEMDVEVEAEPKSHLILLAKNLNGYSNLCKIITRAQLAHEKGEAAASLSMIEQYKGDLFCLSGCIKGEVASRSARGDIEGAKAAAAVFMEVFGKDHFLIEMQNHMLPGTALLNYHLNGIATELGLRCVATNNAHYAAKEDFKIQDLLACVQTITKLDERHPMRKLNSEYYLKTPRAMANLFRKYPKAVAAADWVARQCNLDLKLGTYRFPDFPVPDGETPYSYLCKLCFDALGRLYKPITPQVTQRLQNELSVIDYLGFAEYFLVVWDIVQFAKSRGIRCSGRGSAADSIVSYCLGVSIVDPIENDLLFERFLNPERKGLPDVDIDFDANRRDEVFEYIYNRYGEDKVAMVCTVNTLQARSSIRELGKAMDFSPVDISRVASALPHVGGKRIRDAIEKYPELRDANLPVSRLETLIEACEKVDNFPRHLGVHLCGLVISKTPLTDLVPLEWATKGVIVSQFDKDDIETLGLVKMDILSLKNLASIEDCLAYIRDGLGFELDIDNIPNDDAPTFELLRSMNTVGCFQVESPGMRGLLGRLAPKEFGDIVAQISLFRPGPMQADMINPYIARRHGEEEISYLHPSLERPLRETYGVILYQEQVISVAHALAGFTYGEADCFRRAMTHDRSQVEMDKIYDSFIAGALRQGVDKKTAEEVFGKLRAFAAYGFCKAHAASFARICYQTAYLKTHFPAQFMAGILNNEPMGFYPPNVIVEEARHSGVQILGVDINKSNKKFAVEIMDAPDTLSSQPSALGYSFGIRVSLSQIKNISEAEVDSILDARSEREFSSFSDFCLRTCCDRPTIENLINCGAFDSFDIRRGKLAWLLGELAGNKKKLKKNAESADYDIRLIDNLSATDLDEQIALLPDVPELTLHEKVQMNYDILGLTPLCHPLAFYREKLTKVRVRRSTELASLPNNTIVRVAGVAVVCMRPPTKSGAVVVFITLEDEYGLADCVVFPKVYDQYGTIIFDNPALIIEGKLQKMGNGISVIVRKIKPLTSTFRTDDGIEIKPFTERKRIAGARSFVRCAGI